MRYFAPLVFCFLLFSCSPVKKEDARKAFRYNESKGITTLDPAFARRENEIRPISQIFNGLVEMDDSLHIKPSIAKHWSISPDGTEYTFYLRNDVYFHDHRIFPSGKGRAVVAADFVYSFNRILDPKIASPGLWVFSQVDTSLNRFRALNDTTFTIKLIRPFASFLGLLTMPYCYVVPHEIAAYYGRDFRSNPVGTGPFMLKIWREGEKLVLSKNPRYFETDSAGNRLPYLDAISVTFITEKQSEFLEFMKGNLDFLSGVQTAYKDVLFTRSGLLNPKYNDKFQLLTQPYLNTEYLGFMLDQSLIKHPYQQKALRKAINYGFNRTEMMKYLRNNLGTPAYNGFIPKGLPAFDKDLEVYRYNPDSARRLLAQSGFPNGKGLPPITLTTTADYVDICEYIQHELAGVGIPVQIEVSNGATFREMVAHSKLAFFRGSWIADYPDAENYLSLFYSKNFSPSGPNTTHFKNSEYDRLYERALLETDELKRNEIYRKMNRIIIEEAPVIPLFYDMVVRICPVTIKNFSGNAMNILRLKRVQKVG